MSSINESLYWLTEDPAEEDFHCPMCGELDSAIFYDKVVIRKIDREKFNQLSEEQKLYINEKLQYGVVLCEHCLNKIKLRTYTFKGIYLLCIILLYVIPIVAILAFLITEFIDNFLEKCDFSFDHAWECDAVRRFSE